MQCLHHLSFMWDRWYPCFVLGFKVTVGNLIRTWQRRKCYRFPEIHLWCDTCWPLDSLNSFSHMRVSVNFNPRCACFPEFVQNFSERQILWSLCSVVFHTLTLKLPIQTLHSVFVSSLENCLNFSKTSTPLRPARLSTPTLCVYVHAGKWEGRPSILRRNKHELNRVTRNNQKPTKAKEPLFCPSLCN